MSEELKTCACCGSKPIIGISNFIPYQIICENPNCQLSGRISGDLDKAINAWNTRHIPEGYKLVNKQVNMESKLADTLADIMDYPTYTDATNIQRIWSDLLEATE